MVLQSDNCVEHAVIQTPEVLLTPCLYGIGNTQLADAYIAILQKREKWFHYPRRLSRALERRVGVRLMSPEPLLDQLLERAECASTLVAPLILPPRESHKIWKLRFFTQTLEPETTRLVDCLLRGFNRCFVDVGAHVGYYAHLAASHNVAAIVAIEMHKPNWNVLRKNVPSAKAYLCACGACNGEAEYIVDQDHSNHSLRARTDCSILKQTTPVRALDDILVENTLGDAVFVVKMDIQGNEYDALCGFRQGMAGGKAVIVMKVETGEDKRLTASYGQSLQMLWHGGYTVYAAESGLLKRIDDATQIEEANAVHSRNILAIPQKSFEVVVDALMRRNT